MIIIKFFNHLYPITTKFHSKILKIHLILIRHLKGLLYLIVLDFFLIYLNFN